MEISVLIDKEFKRRVTTVWLRKVTELVLHAENIKTRVEVGLVITGQEKIRELNRCYLEEDRPTDVLSFPMLESDLETIKFVKPPDKMEHLGDVIISYPQAKQQAKEHCNTTKREIAVLIIHGLLHLLGYDHDTPVNKRKMRMREAAIIKIIEEKLL